MPHFPRIFASDELRKYSLLRSVSSGSSSRGVGLLGPSGSHLGRRLHPRIAIEAVIKCSRRERS